jgi:hypothetical protein
MRGPRALVVLLSCLSYAAPGEPPARAEEPRATLSVGLLELFPPTTVALTTELPLGRRIALAATTAYGVRSLSGGGSTTGWAGMLAPRFYALGRVAEGLHVDVAFAYARAVEGPIQGDLQPPAGFSVGPVAGYETRPFPGPLVLGIAVGLLHPLWNAPEGGGVPWLQPWGDVTAGLAF